jgi:hypothetical protein
MVLGTKSDSSSDGGGRALKAVACSTLVGSNRRGRPGQRMIGLLADGSSMDAIQGLWNAGQLRLPASRFYRRSRE